GAVPRKALRDSRRVPDRMGHRGPTMSIARRGWVLLFAAACVAAERDAVEVLARFGEVVRENASRMPNCTCVETIERQYYRANFAAPPRNCDDLAAEKKKRGYKLTLDSTDRLRLDVH